MLWYLEMPGCAICHTPIEEDRITPCCSWCDEMLIIQCELEQQMGPHLDRDTELRYYYLSSVAPSLWAFMCN